MKLTPTELYERLAPALEDYPAEADAKHAELTSDDSNDTKLTRNWFDPVIEATIGPNTHRLYRPVEAGWDAIDILMPIGVEDETRRYIAQWSWAENSCAVDAVLCIALHLNAWRVQADQEPRPRKPNLASHVLHTLARLPWGMLEQHQRNKIRDVLRRFVAQGSGNFKKANEARPIDEAYAFVFAELPQVSCLMVDTYQCCNEESTRTWAHFRSCSLFTPKKHSDWESATSAKARQPRTTAELLQSVFDAERVMGHTKANCTKPKTGHCPEYIRRSVVVGRLPPVISVLLLHPHLGEVDLTDMGSIEITFQQWDTYQTGSLVIGEDSNPLLQKAHYQLRAVIYHTARKSHYAVESSLQKEKTKGRVHMDMLGGGVQTSKCAKETSWELTASGPPVLLIFKSCQGGNKPTG